MKLAQSFFLRKNVTTVAKQLLGKILVTKVNNRITSGVIVETEAYSYKERGSHAYKGKTKRNEVMFDAGGIAYVYLCYGVHEMFNVVTNERGKAEAVLVRALKPLDGIEVMMKRRNAPSSKENYIGSGQINESVGH